MTHFIISATGQELCETSLVRLASNCAKGLDCIVGHGTHFALFDETPHGDRIVQRSKRQATRRSIGLTVVRKTTKRENRALTKAQRSRYKI
jgi:hypothetical protein